MEVEQENVSRLERRADLLLSTLGNSVASMGGKFRMIAEFPNRRPVAIALAEKRRYDANLGNWAKAPTPPIRSFDPKPDRRRAGEGSAWGRGRGDGSHDLQRRAVEGARTRRAVDLHGRDTAARPDRE